MKILLISFITLFSITTPPSKTVYHFKVNDIDGKEVALSQYKGKVILMVNVASKCGNTPQYKDIEALYQKYSSKGLVVLGFPANDFMGQEPGDNAKIKEFCSKQYAVTFPMFSKISVKGKDIAPLYSYLTKKSENGIIDAPVKWNFQKFIIKRDGTVSQSISPFTSVNEAEVVSAIEKALAE